MGGERRRERIHKLGVKCNEKRKEKSLKV